MITAVTPASESASVAACYGQPLQGACSTRTATLPAVQRFSLRSARRGRLGGGSFAGRRGQRGRESFDGGAAQAAELTNSSGYASSPGFTANTVAGRFTATAAVTGITEPASFSLDNLAGKPPTPAAASAAPPCSATCRQPLPPAAAGEGLAGTAPRSRGSPSPSPGASGGGPGALRGGCRRSEPTWRRGAGDRDDRCRRARSCASTRTRARAPSPPTQRSPASQRGRELHSTTQHRLLRAARGRSVTFHACAGEPAASGGAAARRAPARASSAAPRRRSRRQWPELGEPAVVHGRHDRGRSPPPPSRPQRGELLLRNLSGRWLDVTGWRGGERVDNSGDALHDPARGHGHRRRQQPGRRRPGHLLGARARPQRQLRPLAQGHGADERLRGRDRARLPREPQRGRLHRRGDCAGHARLAAFALVNQPPAG